MCWKKSLGEGNEVQADGSCLSFLPVRVRMPRVTQGSDPALSWGAAPFPRDPNTPQGAKPGKKNPSWPAVRARPSSDRFWGAGRGSVLPPAWIRRNLHPQTPSGCQMAPLHRPWQGWAVCQGSFGPTGSQPIWIFPCLPLDLRPWMLEQLPAVPGSERRRGDSGHQEGPGQQQNPRAQRGSGSWGCWDPVEIQAEGSSASAVPVFGNPVGNSLLSRPEKGRGGHAETPSPGRLHPKAWHCPLSAWEPPCLPIPGFSSLGMRDSSSRAPSGPCWVFVHLPRRPGVLFPFSSPRHAPELV